MLQNLLFNDKRYLDNTGPPCKHEHQADKRGGSGEARSFSSTYTRNDRAIGYCH